MISRQRTDYRRKISEKADITARVPPKENATVVPYICQRNPIIKLAKKTAIPIEVLYMP
jgi:hypothetical protein